MTTPKRGGVFFPSRPTEKARILQGVGGQKAIQLLHLHHARVGGRFMRLLCPYSHFASSCPYCEWEVALREKAQEFRSGAPSRDGFTPDEVEKFADKYKPSSYVGMGIVLRRENEKGGWLPSSVNGPKQFLLLAGGLKNPVYLQLKHAAEQWGDLSHPQSGRDMLIVSDQNTKGYWNIKSILVDQQPSWAFNNENELLQVMSDRSDLKKMFQPRPPQGVSVYDFLRSMRDDADAQTETEPEVEKESGNECFTAVKERIQTSGSLVSLDDVESVL